MFFSDHKINTQLNSRYWHPGNLPWHIKTNIDACPRIHVSNISRLGGNWYLTSNKAVLTFGHQFYMSWKVQHCIQISPLARLENFKFMTLSLARFRASKVPSILDLSSQPLAKFQTKLPVVYFSLRQNIDLRCPSFRWHLNMNRRPIWAYESTSLQVPFSVYMHVVHRHLFKSLCVYSYRGLYAISESVIGPVPLCPIDESPWHSKTHCFSPPVHFPRWPYGLYSK